MDQAECWKMIQETDYIRGLKSLSPSYGEFITTYSAAHCTIRGHVGWILRTFPVIFPNRTL